ncbi:hypothetical protein HLPR_05680 [Helicovermis profundi]|uniref:Transposase n=1 Tax=Helicovermis profundi TaxID=3065157 RepID=A0AAU9E6G6_9FIRM|nr:hypothetical protein HLPR_05680 [Clostridia bacterium S502]
MIEYYKFKYNKTIKPINHRIKVFIPKDILCPRCGATHDYLYTNNGNYVTNSLTLLYPHCNHTLEKVKSRKSFFVHK